MNMATVNRSSDSRFRVHAIRFVSLFIEILKCSELKTKQRLMGLWPPSDCKHFSVHSHCYHTNAQRIFKAQTPNPSCRYNVPIVLQHLTEQQRHQQHQPTYRPSCQQPWSGEKHRRSWTWKPQKQKQHWQRRFHWPKQPRQRGNRKHWRRSQRW